MISVDVDLGIARQRDRDVRGIEDIRPAIEVAADEDRPDDFGCSRGIAEHDGVKAGDQLLCRQGRGASGGRP